MRAAFLALGLSCVLGQPAHAQQVPRIVIPIIKERNHYYNVSEDGKGLSCGVFLEGSFPVYRGRTNLSDYRVFIPGVQNPGPFRLQPDGRFRFTAYFNGVSGPISLVKECPSVIGEGLPEWHAEYIPKPPRASFTATAIASEPGAWNFQSTSTDPEEQVLTEKWVFGDGGTGNGQGEVYRYRKPGNFSVALTVTDADGLTNRATRTIGVPAPKAQVRLTLFNKHPLNQVEIEEEFDVVVRVQASDDGVGPLSELAFVTNALRVPSQFQVLKAPGGTNIGTLQPGGQQDFTWRLKGTNSGEFALVSSGVRGKDAAGRVVSGVGDAELGEITSLIVGITQNPPRVALGEDNNNDGKTNALDMRLELVIGITNVSKQDVTGVKAFIVNDPIQLTSLAEDLNIWITPLDVPSGDFGTISPGAANAVVRTNIFEATDRTYAKASILLQGKVGNAGVQARGEGIVNVGGETLLEARFDVEDRPYKSGQPVRIFGSLKNVSKFRSSRGVVLDEGKTVGVTIYPKTEGNGAGGFIFKADSGAKTPISPTGFVLAPDEELKIESILRTSEDSKPTSVNLNYEIRVFVLEGEKFRPADPTQYEVVEKDGWSARHVVPLAAVPVVKDPLFPCPNDLLLLDYLSCRFVNGVEGALRGLGDAALLAGSGLAQMPGWRMKLFAWRIWITEQSIDALLGDEKARRRVAEEIRIDLQALKDVGVQSLQGVAVSTDAVLRSMDKSLRQNRRDFDRGNYRQVAGNVAEVMGENVDLAFEGLVAARSLKAASLAGEGVEGVAAAARREALQRQTDELAGKVADNATQRGASHLPTSGILKSGMDVTDLPAVWRDAYGARQQDILNLLKVAKDEGVMIAFRSRSPRAAELFDQGLAWLKPGGVSIKTVNEHDRIFLGYADDWDGKAYLVEPPVPWKPPGAERDALMEAYLDRFGQLKGNNDFSKDLRASVRARLETRLDEWPKQLQKFSDYADNGIDVDFHAERNGLSERLIPNNRAKQRALVTSKRSPRGTDFPADRFSGSKWRARPGLAPPGYGRGTGVFRDITGDID